MTAVVIPIINGMDIGLNDDTIEYAEELWKNAVKSPPSLISDGGQPSSEFDEEEVSPSSDMVYQTSAAGSFSSCGAAAAFSTPTPDPEFLSYWNPPSVVVVLFSFAAGPWDDTVVVIDDALWASAAMASTITTGELSIDEVVVLDAVVLDDIADEIAVTFKTGIGVVGEVDGPGVDVAITTPWPFISCPWEGVAYPHTTLT